MYRQRSPNFCFWLSWAAMPVFSLVWYYYCSKHKNKFVHKIVVTQRIQPFPAIWSSWFLFWDPSMRILIDSSASTIQAYFCLVFPTAQQVSLHGQCWSLQSIAAGIGISTFYEHFSFHAWIPHRQDQWSKHHAKIWHCRALVSRSPTFASLCVSMHQKCVRIVFPHLWPSGVWPWSRLVSCQSLTGPCVSIWRFFT